MLLDLWHMAGNSQLSSSRCHAWRDAELKLHKFELVNSQQACIWPMHGRMPSRFTAGLRLAALAGPASGCAPLPHDRQADGWVPHPSCALRCPAAHTTSRCCSCTTLNSNQRQPCLACFRSRTTGSPRICCTSG